MFIYEKILTPIWLWLGAVGLNLASMAFFTNLFYRAESCNGLCGACGLGCVSAFVGVATGGALTMTGRSVLKKAKLSAVIKERLFLVKKGG